MIGELLPSLADGQVLSLDEMRRAMNELMEGDFDPVQAASFLTALRLRGESAEELAGAALAMREHAAEAKTKRSGLVDTCGTGGSHVPTFNVSTAAALVVSACGVPVAKHGNRSFSSPSGSADVLHALGVHIEAPREVALRCLDEIGLCFFFAPLWHPAMRNIAPIRRALRFRTLFNLVGPLANPAPIDYQLVGVGRIGWMQKMARALKHLNVKRAAVVCSEDGLDEVTLSAPTHAIVVTPDSEETVVWTHADFGLSAIDVKSVEARSAEESAATVRAVVEGQGGPARDLVLANASAALWLAGKVRDVKKGVAKAAEAVDAGHAKLQLQRLIELTQAASA